ncbi:MAG: aminodeoxychorismate lyase, partial [Terriglobales bacterium]
MRTLIILFLIAVLGAVALAAWQVYGPVAPPPGQTFVMLRPGYSTRRIATELKRAGIIRSEVAFLLWHVVHPKPTLKAGEYLFERSAA